MIFESLVAVTKGDIRYRQFYNVLKDLKLTGFTRIAISFQHNIERRLIQLTLGQFDTDTSLDGLRIAHREIKGISMAGSDRPGL
jgi:hypothetical protein